MERFWAKVDKTDPSGCWIWKGCRTSAGYGQIRTGGLKDGKALYAHRMMWETIYGNIPESMEVLHKCDNPSCVNPTHLFLGTQADNINDCVRKGRFNRPFGENHPKAILTQKQVQGIREATLSQRKLAHIYGVSRGAIQGILSKRNWRKEVTCQKKAWK